EAVAKLTKSELVDTLRRHRRSRKGNKDELVLRVLEDIPAAALAERLAEFVAVERQGPVELFKLLYFGTVDGDMSEFVIRDVGHVRLEERKSFAPRFRSRKAIDDVREVELAYRDFRRIRETEGADTVWHWFNRVKLKNLDEAARPLHARLVGRTGRLLERAGQPDRALSVYRHAEEPPSRERRARVLGRMGRVEEALRECEAIMAAPFDASERLFAEDFSGRLCGGSRRGQARSFLAESDEIRLPRTETVEADAARHLSGAGQNAAHTENTLWRSLFVLTLWDALFDESAPVFHTPLQRGPSDLFQKDFYERRRIAIEAALQSVSLPVLRGRYDKKRGIAAPLMCWDPALEPLIFACFDRLQPVQLAAVLREMARDVRNNSRGFPDLFVWGSDTCEFVEVKSPNDQLSAQQLHWLRFFSESGIRARAVRVVWDD
ncbi:MAG: VRR-NUC domain-containing protein, partial [Myxococcota bacterium]